jgi:nitrogen-specific signal transduction histidine kinase
MTTKKYLDDDSDPTERHQAPHSPRAADYAQASIIHLSAFLRNNPSPILVYSADGEIVKVNPAAQRLLKRCQIDTTHLLPPNHGAILQICLATAGQDPEISRQVGDRIFQLTYQAIAQFHLVSLYITEIRPRPAIPRR